MSSGESVDPKRSVTNGGSENKQSTVKRIMSETTDSRPATKKINDHGQYEGQ